MEKVNIYVQMEINTLENMLKTKCMEKVNIYMQMELNTLENILKAKCMEKVKYGQMEINTLENIVEGKMHGKGEYLWADGDKYVGNMLENIFMGRKEIRKYAWKR